MATTNMGLTTPATTDVVDVGDLNDNMQTLDAHRHAGGASGLAVQAVDAGTLASRPSTPADGQVYVDTTTPALHFGSGGSWRQGAGEPGQPLGLSGATAATRYAGGTASGAPTSGTFAIGDFVIDQTGRVYVCTVAGTPGTWKQQGEVLGVTRVTADQGSIGALRADQLVIQGATDNKYRLNIGVRTDVGTPFGQISYVEEGVAWRNVVVGCDNAEFGYDPGDRVGVKTSAPGYALDVNGACHASSFPTSSDRRLKKSIQPVRSVLQRLKQIIPVTFEWDETYKKAGRFDDRQGRKLGVIAQEVEAQFPEVVTEWDGIDGESYKAVDYGRLAAVLIAAVQELDERLNELELQR